MRTTTTLFTTIFLFLLILSTGCDSSGELGGNPDFRSNIDSVSYSLGYFYGRSMSEEGVDEFNYNNFFAGMQKAFEEQESELSDMEMQFAIQNFQMSIQERQDADRATQAEANIAEGEQFLRENAERDDVEVTDSGLQYRVIEEGSGDRPTADSEVRVHYRGTLIDGEEFDSSYSRGEPAEFPLNAVISGWTEGVQLMREGATYEFFIPANLGYGNTPPPNSAIQPGAVLIFEVELLEIL